MDKSTTEIAGPTTMTERFPLRQDDKQAKTIQQMFAKISDRYDKANDFISLGWHSLWRKQLVRWSNAQPGYRILDCATGTGDLAFDFARAVGPKGQVTATDFCEPMLEHGERKAKKRRIRNVDFEAADILRLPYEDNSFDIVSVSYGIRNVEDPLQGLSELGRVAKPGGLVMILETGQTEIPIYRQAYDLYFRHVVPLIGEKLTGDRAAYQYLQKSAYDFPYGDKFSSLALSTNQFSTVDHKALLGGVSYIYKARKAPLYKKNLFSLPNHKTI